MTSTTPTTITALVTYVDAGDPTICGIAYGGHVYEAHDVRELGVAVSNQVLADYVLASRQWVIVAIVV